MRSLGQWLPGNHFGSFRKLLIPVAPSQRSWYSWVGVWPQCQLCKALSCFYRWKNGSEHWEMGSDASPLSRGVPSPPVQLSSALFPFIARCCLCWLHRSTAVFLPVKGRVLPWPALHESVGLYRVPVSVGPDALVSAGCAQAAVGPDSPHFFGVQQAIWILGSTDLSIDVRETQFHLSL